MRKRRTRADIKIFLGQSIIELSSEKMGIISPVIQISAMDHHKSEKLLEEVTTPSPLAKSSFLVSPAAIKAHHIIA